MIKFAEDMKKKDRIKVVPLGQSQVPETRDV